MILNDNRKNIPPFQYITKCDINQLLECVVELNLLNRKNWHYLNFNDDNTNKFQNITNKHSQYYSNWFQFSTGKYQDLFLNEIDYPLINSNSVENFDSKKSRVKVIKDKKLLKQQNNAEYIFKPILKDYYKNTYIATVYNQISKLFPGGAGRAKIGYMAAQSTVGTHIDADSSSILKVHIPLITNPNVVFFSKYKNEWQSCHMPADGTALLLNVGLPHRVENTSNLDRYHLIINIYSQE